MLALAAVAGVAAKTKNLPGSSFFEPPIEKASPSPSATNTISSTLSEWSPVCLPGSMM